MEVQKNMLDSVAKLISQKFDSAEFVEYLSENETGRTFLTYLKEDYLDENKYPSVADVEDLTWEVFATVYSPWVSVADFIFSKIGRNTYPDAESFAKSDFKTFYGYLMELIGKGVYVEVKAKETPEEMQKEENGDGNNMMSNSEKVTALKNKFNAGELNNMVIEMSGTLPEFEVYLNDEDFFNQFYSNKPYEAILATSRGEYSLSDDVVTFDGNLNLKSYSNSEFSAELLENQDEILDNYLDLLSSGDGQFREKIEEILEEEI